MLISIRRKKCEFRCLTLSVSSYFRAINLKCVCFVIVYIYYFFSWLGFVRLLRIDQLCCLWVCKEAPLFFVTSSANTSRLVMFCKRKGRNLWKTMSRQLKRTKTINMREFMHVDKSLTPPFDHTQHLLSSSVPSLTLDLYSYYM